MGCTSGKYKADNQQMDDLELVSEEGKENEKMRVQERKNHSHALGEGDEQDEDIDYHEDRLDASRTPKPFTEVENRLKTTVDYEKIIRQGKPFEDDQFQAELNSLFDKRISEYYESGNLAAKRTKRRQRHEKNWDMVVWNRPADVHGKNTFLLFDGIESTDIQQGQLGNCYFLAAVSALANHPQRIQDMFLTRQVNDSGCYAVRLWLEGQEQVVVIDDKLPYDESPERDTWAFTNGNTQREIWTLLLEKAFAKILGSYEIMEGGKPYMAFYFLTGWPSEVLTHSEYKIQSIWNKILKGKMHNLPMVTAINSNALGDYERLRAEGLSDHHAYTLLDAKELNMKDGSQTRLLKIRNPYGTRSKREWEGDWGDDSEKWNAAIEEQLGGHNLDKNDGIFWMELEDFVRNFYQTSISQYRSDYRVQSIQDTHADSRHCVVKMTVFADIERPVIIDLAQCHKKFIATHLKGQYTYAALQMYLARIDVNEQNGGETVNLVAGCREYGQPLVHIMRERIKKGEYLIIFRANFKTIHSQRTLSLNVRSPELNRLSIKKINDVKYGKDVFISVKSHY